jgi:methanogenic corrinoid protein MtbC1
MDPDVLASLGALSGQTQDGFHAPDGRASEPAAHSEPGRMRGANVGFLAGQVLAMLGARGGCGAGPRDAGGERLDDARLERLGDRVIAAGLSGAASALDDLVAEFRREGIGSVRLIDEVLPHAARELGRAWEDDRMSFVEVTLVMTRMQRLLRETLSSSEREGAQESVLFVLPEGEQHTLGALIAVQQLRRMGFGAMLCIGEKTSRLAEMLRIRHFDVAFVSVSSYQALDSARDAVKCLRRETADAMPVVVGGALVCGTSDAAAEDLRRQLGAQMVSNDLCAAMEAMCTNKGQQHVATA